MWRPLVMVVEGTGCDDIPPVCVQVCECGGDVRVVRCGKHELGLILVNLTSGGLPGWTLQEFQTA